MTCLKVPFCSSQPNAQLTFHRMFPPSSISSTHQETSWRTLLRHIWHKLVFWLLPSQNLAHYRSAYITDLNLLHTTSSSSYHEREREATPNSKSIDNFFDRGMLIRKWPKAQALSLCIWKTGLDGVFGDQIRDLGEKHFKIQVVTSQAH